MISVLNGVLLVGALVVLILSLRSLTALRRDRTWGALTTIDDGPSRRTFYAPRSGLSGRPDSVRTLADGRAVPVELKSRSSPARGPLTSHRVQVEAYCLILEEATGRAPPFGVLRYGDGVEWQVPWDGPARAEVVGLLAELRREYDGRATPTRAKCAGCAWRAGCDARAA